VKIPKKNQNEEDYPAEGAAKPPSCANSGRCRRMITDFALETILGKRLLEQLLLFRGLRESGENIPGVSCVELGK